ncbi:MFS transporter [Kocuria sp.]|uniref:MFS transporter n=1 Tax=Kocuria sp. TaxID=1871328 RepID=UPI0026E032BC|nr:MFS transporter [Kocuria sp.]MDO5618472.1 MFS transporter [Kocuria sp.]
MPDQQPASAPVPAAELRKARWATGGFFLVNGAVYANLLPRLPEVKEAFELTNTQFGFLVIALPIGSLLAGMAPAPLLRRFGSAKVAGIGSALLAMVVASASVSVALAGTGAGSSADPSSAAVPVVALVVAYVLAMLLAGTADAVVDTAQNAQAIDIQKAMGRSILNSMHALWSLGAMVGGVMGSTAAALELPLPLHLTVSGVIFAAVALIAQRFALTRNQVEQLRTARLNPALSSPEPTTPERATSANSIPGATSPGTSTSTRRALALVVLISTIAISGSMVEDLGMNWSTLFLARILDTPAGLAGMGLVALMAAQFIGRLLGDTMTNRHGRIWMTRFGGSLAATGLAVVALAPSPAVAIAGFAVAGFGSATLVPSAFHAADSVPGLKPGTGLTLAGWLLRVAFLTVSPFVGFTSDILGLRVAILAVPVVAIFAIVVAGVLKERDPHQS